MEPCRYRELEVKLPRTNWAPRKRMLDDNVNAVIFEQKQSSKIERKAADAQNSLLQSVLG